MTGRRGARSGRGWDAIPPRPVNAQPADSQPGDEDPADGGPRRDETERGNVPARRRRGSPGTSAFGPAIGGSGTGQPSGGRRGSGGRGPFGGAAFGSSGTEATGRGRGGYRRGAQRPDDADLGAGRPGAGGEGKAPGAGLPWSLNADAGSGADAERRAGGWRADGTRSRADSPRPATPQSESERAREICLNQLAARPRTRVELAKVLARKEISEEAIAEVLDRYDEVGIIDDAAFARAWVSSRHHGRGLARRALANELRQHGVDAEIASEALESLDEEAEATTARELVDRKLRTATGTPEAIFRRLVSMLARKGYPGGVAYRVVKEALAARDAEAAEFAEGINPDDLSED